MGAPPIHAGLYEIRNTTTQQVYIGKSVNLRRRYSEWKGVWTSGGVGATSQEMIGAIRETPTHDWGFSVLCDMPGATEAELRVSELAEIHKAMQRGGCLNTIAPEKRLYDTSASVSGPAGNTRKSTILDESGNPMNYAAAARVLGITRQAVKKRLQVWRAKETYSVNIADWAALHKTHRSRTTI